MPDPLRIALIYPSLLGTYGDGGNASVLAQRAINSRLRTALPCGQILFIITMKKGRVLDRSALSATSCMSCGQTQQSFGRRVYFPLTGPGA